ncbi:MAG: sulfatase [Planctomycetaceae bacterium]|nr:sulfatase [Planctomycetaceae bacterium]
MTPPGSFPPGTSFTLAHVPRTTARSQRSMRRFLLLIMTVLSFPPGFSSLSAETPTKPVSTKPVSVESVSVQSVSVESVSVESVSVESVSVESVSEESASEESASERPNILFIAIDDLRPGLGCYGDPLAKSPHVDQFARSARRFDRAYSQQAVCGPSRTSLLTGRLPDHTRVWHNRNRFRDIDPDLVTLPQLFREHGYRTVSLGKVFSGDERELDPDSWSEPEVLKAAGWKNALLPENQGTGKHAAWEAADVDDEAYPDGKLAALAIQRLEEFHREPQPFFLAVGFFKPHLPFNAPRKYWDLYDPALFELASDAGPVTGAPELALHTHRELGGYRGIPEDEQVDTVETRRLRHGYYACVSYVDAQIGKLLSKLQRLELDRRTIVVLWGDHGFSLGENGRWCKGTNFERDTRVPLLIRTPGMSSPGAATEALVQLVDIYPTLAELAGLAPPGNLDGRSLVRILNDPQSPGRAVVLSQFNRPWKATTPEQMGYSIRTDTHRYTRWIDWKTRATLAEELYDYRAADSVRSLNAHLIEQANVVNDPARAAVRDRLRQVMDRTITIPRRLSEPPPSSTPDKKKKKDRSQ